MARSSGGRPVRSSHPSWPPLRVRAVVNGLLATTAGVGLLWLTWGVLDFTVYDASAVPAPVRIIALWFAVGMPIAWLAIGLHLVVAGLLSSDRVLLAHGSAQWEPGAQDDVLRGVRVRRWRVGLFGGRRLSAPTLGWLPELSPYALAPLGGGVLALVVMLAWMARGYGAGVIALIAAILWLGWRLLRGWQAWSDVRDLRARPRPSDLEAESTPDEVWEDEHWDDDWQDEPAPARSRAEDLDSTTVLPRHREDRPTAARIAATRRVDRADNADPTDALPLYVDDEDPREHPEDGPQTAPLETVPRRDEPLRRGRRGSRRARGDSERAPADDGPPEVLVDRSVQRAIRAKQARRGAATEREPARGRSGRRRGSVRECQRPGPAAAEEKPQGLRAYLGQRSHQGHEDSGTRSLGESGEPSPRREDRGPAPRPRSVSRPGRSEELFDQERPASSGAPSSADAMDEIYGHDDHAPSLLSYLSRRRDDEAR